MGYFSELDAQKGYPATIGRPYEDYIYLIVGSTGEYEEYFEWTVTAFGNKTDALEFKQLLDRIVSTHNQESRAEYEEDAIIEEKLKPYDSRAQVDGYIHYKVEKVSFNA